MGSSRWKFSFHHQRSSSTSSSTSSVASTGSATTTNTPKKKKTPPPPPPPEFLCPISSALMSDPVIVPTGHTFERNIIQACLDLRLFPKSLFHPGHPILSSSSSSSPHLIPNLALRSTIFSWCDAAGLPRPQPPDPFSAIDLVRSLLADDDSDSLLQGVDAEKKKEPPNHARLLSHTTVSATTDITCRNLYSSCSDVEESAAAPPLALPLATKPSSYSSLSSSPSASVSPSSSSSEINPLQPSSQEEEEIVRKLKSVVIFEQEEAVASLRNISRSSPEQRIPLCTPRLLAGIRPLLLSRYPQVQINATAALVNLSLEKPNKERIVRSGAVPPLIDVLKGGCPEAQEHAAGAIFSLALEEDNKPAIGVLGALQPLLHMLRHESHRARQDAAMALYHLSLMQCNRAKLVKLGAVPLLLGYSKGGELAARAMLILCNLALGVDGRAALLDADAVGVFVEMLRDDSVGETMREHCVAVLYAMSSGGSVLRFKGMAKAAGAVEVLKEVADRGKSERVREKARRMLMILKGKGDVTAAAVEGIFGGSWEDEGERIQEDDATSDTGLPLRQWLPSKEKTENGANSTDF